MIVVYKERDKNDKKQIVVCNRYVVVGSLTVVAVACGWMPVAVAKDEQ